MKFLIVSIWLASSLAFAKVKSISATVEVTGAKIFAPMKGSTATAGYAVIKNTSDKEVVLKVVKTEPFKAVETHQTKEKAGKMAMEKVESFKIPAQGSLELKPGGNHIMLFDPNREVKVGEELVVHFDIDGKTVESKFKVESRTEGATPGHH